MRRFHLLLIAALAVGAAACTPQGPEVVLNAQVPADQALAEPEPGAEGEEGGAAVEFANADVEWDTENLEFIAAPDTMPSEAIIGMLIPDGNQHNVVFEGFEGDRALVEGAGAGEYAAAVTVPPGEYTYYCSIAGHRTAGMEGSITVVEGTGGGGDAEGGASEGGASEGGEPAGEPAGEASEEA